MNSTLSRSVAAMGEAGRRFPWSRREAYAGWLAQTYFYVRHSTRLLAAAASRFPQSQAGDQLHHRFAAHIREESRHERLALRDLAQLGSKIEELPELPETRMFYEPQYFKVEHCAPSALFGYILPLEVLAPEHAHVAVEQVETAFGPSVASFLKLHAQEDVAHVEQATQFLEAVPPMELVLLEENMEQTAAAYVNLLEAIQRKLPQ